MMSPRPRASSSSRSSGTSVRWPAASERDADDVDVVVDRLLGRLAGRLEQGADVDVEAEVGEGGGDHLLAAVVAVLAHLGDQDARPPALGRRRTPRPVAGACVRSRARPTSAA